jgi:hypothetical protein
MLHPTKAVGEKKGSRLLFRSCVKNSHVVIVLASFEKWKFLDISLRPYA